MSLNRWIDQNWDLLIKWVPPQIAHDMASVFLKIYCSQLEPLPHNSSNYFQWKNLSFKNRLGLAGGADKNAKMLDSWNRLGFGFIEVGTVTPYSQKANPGKILMRDIASQSLWNKMGFPNDGADEVIFNLLRHRADFQGPVFVNIGKNRWTTDEEAHLDYAFLARRFESLADAFVINVSSPNTKGLRGLQNKEALEKILTACRKNAPEKPFLIKLSPDVPDDEFKNLIRDLVTLQIDGFILTNTTTSRLKDSPFPIESGGASGKSVTQLSIEKLRAANQVLQDLGLTRESKHRPLIISTGGVFTHEDLIERITLGADLIQCYSSMVLKGPGVIRQIL